VVDWNEDGKKDLITGGYDGRVRIFLNTGADSAPVFDGYTLLQVGGIEFRCTKFSFPGVVDWNNDGKKDVFCGEQSGKVNLLINEGSNSAPLFNSQSYVKEGLIDLKVPFRSNPVVADWNGERGGRSSIPIRAHAPTWPIGTVTGSSTSSAARTS